MINIDSTTGEVTHAPIDSTNPLLVESQKAALAVATVDPAVADFKSTYDAMQARLTDIITNGSTYTAAQMQAAIVDEARLLRRMLRFCASRLPQ